MKIVLTHGYFIGEDAKEQEIMRPYAPLGILYISAWLEKNGYKNSLFDTTFSSFSLLQEYLLKEKPDVIGIYTNLMTKLNVLRTIQFIRNREELSGMRIVLGGPEVRNHVNKFLEHGADYIVLGEGEQTMHELVLYLDGKSEKQAAEIDGIAWKDSAGAVVKNQERTKMKELDELPLPNRSGINMQLYFDAWKKKHGTSAISINTMRGCPYTCKWCSRAVYGQSYRRRSPQHVANEIAWIRQHYEVDSIWFVDDVFTVSHKWLAEFAEEMNSRNMVTPFECITRADRMNEEVVQLLKKAGCFRVWIGAESGSQRVIDLMDRRVDVQQVRDMIRLARKHGIQAGTFIMVGYPGETEEDIYETVEHLKQSNPDLFTITVAYPIKGTELYQETENIFIENLPWETSTDRDIDFQRTHPRKYYDHAVSFIINEMNAFKAAEKGDFKNLLKLKIKATASRLKMSMAKM